MHVAPMLPIAQARIIPFSRVLVQRCPPCPFVGGGHLQTAIPRNLASHNMWELPCCFIVHPFRLLPKSGDTSGISCAAFTAMIPTTVGRGGCCTCSCSFTTTVILRDSTGCTIARKMLCWINNRGEGTLCHAAGMQIYDSSVGYGFRGSAVVPVVHAAPARMWCKERGRGLTQVMHLLCMHS